MPFTSGTYSLPTGNPVVPGTTISSTTTNTTNSDIATALSACLLKDGTQTVTANIPMASHKITGLSAGTTAGDSVEYGGSPSFTDLTYTGTLTGSTGILNIGSGQVYKDASGNMGIGTSSPAVKLQVNGRFGLYDNSQTVPTPDNGSVPIFVMSSNFSSSSGEASLWNTAAALPGGIRLSQVTGSGTYNDMAWFQKNLALFYTNNTERMRIDSSGNMGIGTSSPNASAILDAQSTTKGVRFPNMTTTQKTAISSPAAGLVVFDTALAKLCVYSGAAWQTITSI